MKRSPGDENGTFLLATERGSLSLAGSDESIRAGKTQLSGKVSEIFARQGCNTMTGQACLREEKRPPVGPILATDRPTL